MHASSIKTPQAKQNSHVHPPTMVACILWKIFMWTGLAWKLYSNTASSDQIKMDKKQNN